MSYSAIKVSRYIIKYSNENNLIISNLKLQKLLYFIQSHFLVQKNEICFTDEIKTSDLGPIVQNVYDEYKHFGAGNIPFIFVSYEISKDDIREDDRKLIDEVIDEFSTFRSSELMEMIKNQDPWIRTYKQGDKISIDTKLLKEFFTNYKRKKKEI